MVSQCHKTLMDSHLRALLEADAHQADLRRDFRRGRKTRFGAI